MTDYWRSDVQYVSKENVCESEKKRKERQERERKQTGQILLADFFPQKDESIITQRLTSGHTDCLCRRFPVVWFSCSRGFNSYLLRAHSKITTEHCGLEPGGHVVYFSTKSEMSNLAKKEQPPPLVSLHNKSPIQIHFLWVMGVLYFSKYLNTC